MCKIMWLQEDQIMTSPEHFYTDSFMLLENNTHRQALSLEPIQIRQSVILEMSSLVSQIVTSANLKQLERTIFRVWHKYGSHKPRRNSLLVRRLCRYNGATLHLQMGLTTIRQPTITTIGCMTTCPIH